MLPDLTDREARLARVRAGMDQACAERRAAERMICRLTEELIEIGAEERAEMKRDTEDASA
jgi:hypothetical protein